MTRLAVRLRVRDENVPHRWATEEGGTFVMPAAARWPILRRLLVGSLTGSLGIGAFADGNLEYHRRAWTREDGLPHNTVRAVLQTRDGYLWAATPAGAARFDGQRFIVLSHTNFPVIASDSCRALAEDSLGGLWIGTDAGLLRWHAGTLTRLSGAHGLLGERVLCLCPSRGGGLWIGTDQGLNRLGGGEFAHFAPGDGLAPGPIEGVAEDQAGGVWVGTSKGVQRRRAGGGRFEDFRPPPAADTALSRYSRVVADQSGAVWLDLEKRLFRVEPGAEAPTPHAGSLIDGRVTAIVREASGGLWVADGSYGLVHFAGGAARSHLVRERPGLDNAYCLALDREGNLWIGTETAGLHCWRRRVLEVLTARDGLAHDAAWAFGESPRGELWIGTDAGLSRFHQGSLRAETLSNRLPNPVVRALAFDSSGALWIGTGNGLAVLRNGTVTTRRFAGASPDDADGKSRNKVRAILPTRDGSLWVAVPTGLYRLRGELETFFTTAPRGQGLPHADVRALHQSQDGSLWVGTAGGGVARVTSLDRSDGALDWSTFSRADGLSSDHAWAFHEEQDGTLWIGTDRGLNRLTFPGGEGGAKRASGSPTPARGSPGGRVLRPTVFVFTARQGLPSDLINFILEDDQARLWISHDRGICRVRKRDLEAVARGRLAIAHCVSYDESDGMLNPETSGQRNQPAGWRTRDGRLWFATAKGVAVIDPREIHENAVSPPVVIEQVVADGETVFADGAVVGAERLSPELASRDRPPPADHRDACTWLNTTSQTVPPTLRLPPGHGRFLVFRFTANSLAQPAQVRFKHRLVGHDSDWIDDGTQRTAAYPHLRPGRYRLQVVAANADGVWNQTGASLSFVLAPFFHQALWFRLTLAAGLLLAVLLVYGWRLGEWRRLQALERDRALASERERIARDLHDDLGAGLQHISLLTGLAERQAEANSALAGHIRQIGETARDSLRTLSHTIWTLEAYSASVASFATYVGELAQRLLAPAGIRLRQECPRHWPEAELSARVRGQLLAAVKESLQNILKHAGATEVRLQFRVEGKTLDLTIEDNGRGFDSRSLPATPGNPKSEILLHNCAGGHGLRNLARRLDELGGLLRLASQKGLGTRVTLSVPVLPTTARRPTSQ